jgi:homoserine dehydrogenase
MRAIEELMASQPSTKPAVSTIRIGIVGYGTVGQATAEILAGHAQEIRQQTGGAALEVTRISRKTPRAEETGVNGAPVVEDWREVVGAADVDIVIEAIGGTGVANEVVRTAISNGKPVVTANKALIARHGEELFALARAKNLPIGIEASVAGGVPVIRAISEALAADRIQAIYGIVNGTCNYVLTQMDLYGIEFAQALHQAQAAGYAEADPSLDIDGLDARDKITILARIAFHGTLAPAQVPTTGIREVKAIDFHYTRRLDGTVRLVASAERLPDGIKVGVRPWLVRRDSTLAKVNGANNAILVAGEKAGTQMFCGPGAGGGATATAVLSDVIHIARHLSRKQSVPDALAGLRNNQPLQLSEQSRPLSWYIRLTVADRPGILAEVAKAIAHERINIDSVIQEPHMHKARLSFVITLEPVDEGTAVRAVEVINQFPFMLESALLLPIAPEPA